MAADLYAPSLSASLLPSRLECMVYHVTDCSINKGEIHWPLAVELSKV